MKQSLIILFVCLVTSTALAVEEREGYCKPFVVPPDSNVTILTVPDGNNFVLLKLHATIAGYPQSLDWSLEVDGNPLFDNYFSLFGTRPGSYANMPIYNATHDFPDRCVVVKCGQTLEAVNSHPSIALHITLIGYFYDATCVSPPVSDLNKDCKVNFADLALLAEEWLHDGHIGT